MAPGGEMFRFYSAFRRERTAYPGGMNASPTEKRSAHANLQTPIFRYARKNHRARFPLGKRARFAYSWSFGSSRGSPKPSKSTVWVASPSSLPSIIRANCSPLMDSLASR